MVKNFDQVIRNLKEGNACSVTYVFETTRFDTKTDKTHAKKSYLISNISQFVLKNEKGSVRSPSEIYKIFKETAEDLRATRFYF